MIGLLLPRHVIVERDLVIDASPDEIFPLVNSFRQGAEWSPWLRSDAVMELSYAGPEEGEGAIFTWTSDDPAIVSGRQEIVESIENQVVVYALDFGEMGTAEAWFGLEPVEGGTRVTWRLDADMGWGPTGRWLGLIMDDWVGADYERGLQSIQALVEET